jgi:hypothetical protein
MTQQKNTPPSNANAPKKPALKAATPAKLVTPPHNTTLDAAFGQKPRPNAALVQNAAPTNHNLEHTALEHKASLTTEPVKIEAAAHKAAVNAKATQKAPPKKAAAAPRAAAPAAKQSRPTIAAVAAVENDEDPFADNSCYNAAADQLCDAMDIAANTIETLVSCNNAALKAAETIHCQLNQFSNTIVSRNAELSKGFFECRTLQDLAQFQARIFEVNSEALIDNNSILREACINYFNYSLQQFAPKNKTSK